ncbi:hypothetical protein OQ252_12140 [Acetobacter farinalis]|uniref:Uncharacterized protein n=1 Tax=Acetobacter farinalis TaxID=1260984 RepID=A0ABT3QA47_9PROT|nr:hypothetical protein [Acetobacter farinalis]MCX2562140.1 hypothetical protein [Acetobacter farinalis]
MTDVKISYPERYYASYDTKAPQPTPVTGWYDTAGMKSVVSVPPAADMIAISAEDWADTTHFRCSIGRGVLDGRIVDYMPPPDPVPLAEQARQALAAARQTVWAEYGALNDPTPQAWVAYLKALRALADGQDAVGTTLPEAPA